MFNLIGESPRDNLNNKEILSSNQRKKKKLFIKINMSPDEKINIKKVNINDKNLIKYYSSVNSSTASNSKSDYMPRNSLKGKIVYSKTNNNSGLSEIDKKKIKSIINNFKKHKVVADRLLNKEKYLALNSVNNSNYSFLIAQNGDTKLKNKNRKLIYRNQYYDCSSNMITKFNNRTFDILDPPKKDPIYSTNLNYFRRQLINNFTEYNENIEYTRKKYNDAMKIGEIHEEKNFKLALKMEQKFYQNKFNILKNQNVKDIKNNINKIKQMHGYFRKSHFSRNTFKMSNTPAKKSKNSILNTFTNNDKNDNSNLKLLPEINKTPIKKPKSDEINLNLYNNKIKSVLSRMKELSVNEIKNEQVLKDFKKIHNSKARKAIKQRSKDLTDSIYEINDYPYQKLSSSYSKENVGNINMHNLARARKINIINKYLYNLEDDDLLIHNPKKLREEIKKVQNACNKTDYKANYNYSFLRKKLRLDTIRKFNCIKDSQFGFPV